MSALNLGTCKGCGHSVNEVMSAVLGSLPLDHLLKSKPVTPCWVVLPDATGFNAERPSGIPLDPGKRKMPDGRPAKRAPSGTPHGDETPPWALAVAEVRPRGSTGRVGAGLHARTSPEMRSGSHHGD